MRKFDLLAASAIALVAALPAHAQTATATPGTGQETPSSDSGYGTDIVVTAQRQAQTLQEVPIAVSAFSAEALEKQ